MGISVRSAGIGVQRDKFYFVNLNADPIMSELLVCYLKVCLLVSIMHVDVLYVSKCVKCVKLLNVLVMY